MLIVRLSFTDFQASPNGMMEMEYDDEQCASNKSFGDITHVPHWAGKWLPTVAKCLAICASVVYVIIVKRTVFCMSDGCEKLKPVS